MQTETGGMNAAASPPARRQRGVLTHAALFVLGFTLVFSFLGASVGLVGSVVQESQRWINLVAGVLLVLFGLHVTGLLRIVTFKLMSLSDDAPLAGLRKPLTAGMYRLTSLLYREKRVDYQPKARGPLASLGVGMAFAVGWTPCVGFILGGILTAALNQSDATGAMFLLLAYSLGLGIPFLLAAAFIDRARSVLRALARHSTLVGWVSGVALIVFGVMIALDVTSQLNQYLGTVPVVDDAFLLEGTSEGLGVTWVAPAFLAGILSFLSPCVLPMVPIYLAHLAGTVDPEEQAA
jgi:cytochrome c-type biogenesis protein